jgi:protein involved in polysaccharide export with SLBB domain
MQQIQTLQARLPVRRSPAVGQGTAARGASGATACATAYATAYAIVRVVAAVLLTAGLAACQGPMPQMTVPATPVGSVDGATQAVGSPFTDARYRLSVGDRLEVRYLRHPENSADVLVGPDGHVSLPYLPSVRAEGRTVDELREAVVAAYAEQAARIPDAADKRYVIGVGDVLEVRFPFLGEYGGTAVVRPDGRISLPLIPSIVAEGRTPEDLGAELEEVYARHFDDPVFVFSVVNSASNAVYANGERIRVAPAGMDSLFIALKSALPPKVFVGGEVTTPTAITYQPMLSSLQAIIAAGGPNKRAELDSVVILRKGVDGEAQFIVRDLAADISGPRNPNYALRVMSGHAGTNDILLRPFDVVIVPRSTIAGVQDVLDQYLYNLIPPLRNSSVGFSYIRSDGRQDVQQETVVLP